MDVDMDIDIDYGDTEPAQQAQHYESAEAVAPTTELEDGPAAYREDNLEPVLPCLDKVYLHGLDNFTPEDVRSYAEQLYPSQDFSRIEWIDDSSANLIYPTEETAAEALESFLDVGASLAGASQLQSAKSHPSHPFQSLQVRQATSHDVKKRGARDESRFYLFNPEYDPRERRKQNDSRRGGRGGRDDRRFKRRRSEPEPIQFDESMYDDPPIRSDNEGRRSDHERRSKRPRFGGSRDDLFADRPKKSSGGRLRDRSASPGRLANGDGRFGFYDDGPQFSSAARSFGRNNPNAGKELLSSPAANARAFLRESSPAPRPKELFPPRSPVRETNAGKELFSNGLGTPYHRRTEAFDAADEAESDMQGSPTFKLKGRSLEDRITGGPGQRPPSREKRGNGPAPRTNPGFIIKGQAKEANARVKELFPDKVGDNSGKELFAGRRNQRQRAEDLFG